MLSLLSIPLTTAGPQGVTMPNGRESTSHHPNPDRNGDALKKTCTCSDTGRNLVVCIDGTSNKFGEKVRDSFDFFMVYNTDKK